MVRAIRLLATEFLSGWKKLLGFGLLFALLFQVLMLIALVVRFQALPNYTSFFNWPGNVVHIIQSTPSWSDALSIIAEEWLVEVGRMNYDYGTGISVWSLNVVPSRLLVLTILGVLTALCFRLAVRPDPDGAARACKANGDLYAKSTAGSLVADQAGGAAMRGCSLAAAGGGTLLIAMTNVTLSWVVCCATPSWVVGLAMLGLGVSTSLALESLGPLLSFCGFSLLCIAILLLAWRKSAHRYMPLEARHA